MVTGWSQAALISSSDININSAILPKGAALDLEE